MRKKKKEKIIKTIWSILAVMIIFSMLAWTMSIALF